MGVDVPPAPVAIDLLLLAHLPLRGEQDSSDAVGGASIVEPHLSEHLPSFRLVPRQRNLEISSLVWVQHVQDMPDDHRKNR